MSLIDKVGTFLGYAPIHGVDTTKKGYPQLVLQCEASHYYDEDVEDYVEVTEQELRAYLVLYGKEGKPIRNCEQVKKVFDWDGLSFQALAEKDISEIRFLFRVEENTYEDNTTLQVSWIDVDTASPTRQISSLDTKDLQKLDAQFGLAKVGKKTDKKKPTGKPTVPGASKKNTTKKDTKKKVEEKTEAQTATEATASGPPAPVAREERTGSTTRDDAWAYIEEQIPEAALSTDDRAIAWTKAIEKIHNGPDDDTLTGEEWFKVQELILSENLPF
jgi:hypothetical protein